MTVSDFGCDLKRETRKVSYQRETHGRAEAVAEDEHGGQRQVDGEDDERSGDRSSHSEDCSLSIRTLQQKCGLDDTETIHRVATVHAYTSEAFLTGKSEVLHPNEGPVERWITDRIEKRKKSRRQRDSNP